MGRTTISHHYWESSWKSHFELITLYRNDFFLVAITPYRDAICFVVEREKIIIQPRYTFVPTYNSYSSVYFLAAYLALAIVITE